MIEVKVIASGSGGNCTALICGKVIILLDAGIGFDRIQRALDFQNPTAALITHEHGDHAKISTVQELLKRGVEIFMTRGTAEALKLEKSHRLNLIEPVTRYQLEDLKFYATPTIHDAAAPVMFSIGNAKFSLRYIVDSGEIPLQLAPTDYLLIETNYLETELLNAKIDATQKERISKNHLSFEKALRWINRNNFLDRFKEIHLMHISKRHGNGEKFRQVIKNLVGADTKVFAH